MRNGDGTGICDVAAAITFETRSRAFYRSSATSDTMSSYAFIILYNMYNVRYDHVAIYERLTTISSKQQLYPVCAGMLLANTYECPIRLQVTLQV